MERWVKGILLMGLIFSVTLSAAPGWARDSEKVVILGDYSTLRTLDPASVSLSQDIMLCRAIYQSFSATNSILRRLKGT